MKTLPSHIQLWTHTPTHSHFLLLFVSLPLCIFHHDQAEAQWTQQTRAFHVSNPGCHGEGLRVCLFVCFLPLFLTDWSVSVTPAKKKAMTKIFVVHMKTEAGCKVFFFFFQKLDQVKMQPSLWGSSLKFVILLCFLNTIFSTHSLECQWTDKSLALKENKLFITFATVYNGELSCFCDLLNKYVLYLTFKSYFRAVNNGLNCLMLLSLNSEGFVYINIDN